MFSGMVSPEQMAEAAKIGEHIKMEVIRYPKQGKIEVNIIPVSANDAPYVNQVVEGFTQMLIEGFGRFFNIKGKVITQY